MRLLVPLIGYERSLGTEVLLSPTGYYSTLSVDGGKSQSRSLVTTESQKDRDEEVPSFNPWEKLLSPRVSVVEIIGRI